MREPAELASALRLALAQVDELSKKLVEQGYICILSLNSVRPYKEERAYELDVTTGFKIDIRKTIVQNL